jgi:putative addiction module killer protein
MIMEIRHYLTASGVDVFQSWLDGLKDLKARVAILRRIDRLAEGNFGDHKFLRDGVSEVRVDLGAGYRVYYGKHGKALVLLLCGGSKRTQAADIARAVEFWVDYRRRQT